MSYEIIPAGLKHIDGILKLEEQCFSLPWSRDNLINYLPSDNRMMLAAIDSEGEVIGYVGLMFIFNEGYIANVAVSPSMRRQGIGTALIESLSAFAIEKKLSFITLEVRESNLPAIGLYEKNGFFRVGVGRNYYEKPRENAILMTKILETEG